MNSDKAREHFSAYREGTLERGMVQALERKLASDAALAQEYREFAAAYDVLGMLSAEVPEPEFDLHDRISARLDRHLLDQKHAAKPGLAGWWRAVTFGGLAVLAIASAIVGLNAGGGNVQQAGVVPATTSNKAAPITLSAENGQVMLRMSSETPRTIEVRDEAGAVLESRTLERGNLLSPLRNAGPEAAVLRVTIQGEAQPILLALPGSSRVDRATGEGSALEVAKAAADQFGVPVALRGETGDAKLRWAFEGDDAFANLSKALSEAGLTVEKRSGGLMVVQGP